MTIPKHESVDSQLYEQMDRKETETLLAMWHENDREAWTNEAFAAMQAVLSKRLGTIPEPDDPEDDLESEAEDASPATKKLLLLATWANRLAWLILSLSVLLVVLRIIEYAGQGAGMFPGESLTLTRLEFWISYAYSLAIGAMYFVLLKVVSEGARFLARRDEA